MVQPPNHKILAQANTSLSHLEKSIKAESKIQLKTALGANRAFTNLINHAKQQKTLSRKTVSSLPKMIYQLYRSKMHFDQEKENTTLRRVAFTMHKTLGKALSLLLPENKGVNEEKISFLFDIMLKSILSDIKEEVVGQERPPGSIPRMLNLAFKKKYKAEMDLPMQKVAADLYPIALIVASLDGKAPLPSIQQESAALARDKVQFISEYKSQFGKNCSLHWLKTPLFGILLKQAWQERRS